MDQSVVIVGGGLGGLSAAIHLAAAGRRITLLEKNARLGGKANLIAEQGYFFDTGPSLLTMPWVVRQLYEVAGKRLEDDLELVQLELTCRYQWLDHTTFNAFQTLPLLLQEIERLEPRDVEGFLRFVAYTRRIYDAVAEPFLKSPFDGLGDMLTPALIRDSWKIDSLRTVDASVRSFFRSPYLRQVFNRYTTYNGSSPYRAPATFNIIPYVEFAEGGWYIKGGMYVLVEALTRLAQHLGVDIHTEAPVTRVAVEHGSARGVIVAGEERIDADQVVINVDPHYAYQHLLPPKKCVVQATQQPELSCSGFVLLLGVNRIYEHIAHHNIFFSHDYPREFAAIFDKRIPPADPTIYICASSVSDPDHAPPGHMNMFVLVNAPTTNGHVNWQHEAEGYRNMVIARLERMGMTNLSQHIVYEQIMTPADIESLYNAPGGAIYGLASNNLWSAFLRPPLRARDIARLYFVGGGTHPGGGIPLVLLSGRAVAHQMLSR
ncbi:MAG: phytoene desaturase [Chloroflexi bacterium AL-W]|nr:phytoene desaturase [Chloroflexi bacterium AL-N1]NOK70055.1 phytoene desaturase [Chloroflexi bacterium AL-N10]NOK77933.1 phytoene desaturase [Chloroflexi bacterium AL-N5]NOK84942.1 phytoene desaturase [Chloroflexi bacterium AL-W]NOK91921.1 phytoene desaturase [Chloroflexi bacterium AL-N15]